MSEIEISIIIPIYNVEKYLKKCLDTVYSIKNIKKEIILVNDSSPDKCYKIIAEYEKKYKNETIVINKENGGLSSARNSGLEVAKGKYVSFIDSDDYIDPLKFEKIFKKGKEIDLDIIIGRAKKVWDNQKRDEDKLVVLDEFLCSDVVSGEEYLRKSLKVKKHRVEVWDDFYKREFLIKNNLNFIEGILHEDVPFTFRAFILAKKVKIFDIDFYYYRQREGSIMSTINKKSFMSRLYLIEDLSVFLENKQINKKEYNDYLGNHLWNIFIYLREIDKNVVNKLLIKKNYSLKVLIKLLIMYISRFKLNFFRIISLGEEIAKKFKK